LSFVEKVSDSFLPINSGQISAFTNDGTIQTNDVFRLRGPGMKNVAQLLGQMMAACPIEAGLEKECIAFCNYLIRQSPNDYVIRKYREAHQQIGLIPTPVKSSFDLFLLNLATHDFTMKWIDAYTSIFSRRAIIRRKWILLIAILESCSPSHEYFDVPEGESKYLLFARMTARCVSFLIKFCLSTLILFPIYLVFSLRAKPGVHAE
jgi:hypothetical protein